MDLKRIIYKEGSDGGRSGMAELRKLRSALGRIVHSLGLARRFPVDVAGSDAGAVALLVGGASLVTFPSVTFAPGPAAAAAVEEGAKAEDGPTADPMEVDPPAETAEPAPPAETEAARTRREDEDARLAALGRYVRSLHSTELSLRSAIMKLVDSGGGSNSTLVQISTAALATSADEGEGDADAEDWGAFLPAGHALRSEDGPAVVWERDGHPLVGEVVYRPRVPSLHPRPAEGERPAAGSLAREKCHWYRVVSHCPPILVTEGEASSQDNANATSSGSGGGGTQQDGPANRIVTRRPRFRAVPVSAADVDSEVLTGVHVDEDDDAEYAVLTEGQVRAGYEAGVLARRLSGGGGGGGAGGVAAATTYSKHPFRNGHGSRVMLTPAGTAVGDGGEDGKGVLYGIVAGYDSRVSCDSLTSTIEF